MIEKILACNFQRFTSLKIEFDPITTIVGPTNHGKTSVIRMLRWVIQNSPQGTSFKKHGAEQTSVSVFLENSVAQRSRSKSNNLYELDGKEYKSFGSNVPPDIEKLFNIHECSFQLQQDSPFWLGEKPAELSRKLNAIINLDVMDQAMEIANRDARKAKSELSVSEERLRLLEEQIAELEWIDQAQNDWETVQNYLTILNDYTSQRDELEALIEEAVDTSSNMDAYGQMLTELEPILELANEIQTLNKDQIELTKHIERMEKAQQYAAMEIPDMTELIQIREDADAIAEESRTIEHLVLEWEKEARLIYDRDKEIRELEQYLAQKQAEEPKCSTCGQTLLKNS
jgi:DNA repair protein SbcC/Rad50